MNDINLSSKVAFEIIASTFDMQTAKNEEELTNAFIKFLKAKGYKVTAPPKEVKDEYTFDRAWNLYEKKVGCKSKLEKKWNSMSKKDRKAATEYIPLYVLSQPDKQYRKNFQTFLNQRGWEDELIGAKEPPTTTNTHPFEISQLIAKTKADQELYTDKTKDNVLRQLIIGMLELLQRNPDSLCKTQLEIYRDNGTFARLGIPTNLL